LINIVVTGTKSEKLKATLTDACNFYMERLGFRKRKRLLEIFIKIGKYDDYGLCEFNQDYYWPELVIYINRNYGHDEMIKTLAHEMVHSKQFLRKELKQINEQMYWHGKPSDNDEWEIEAYTLEEKLYNEYKNERT
jgi:hypothetical protein